MHTLGYSETFKIRTYDMDAGGRASIQAVCNYLQEIASMHAAALGFSVTELFRRNLTWVLSRLHVQMHRFPRWGDTITIETWPSTMTGLFALREFVLRDDATETIGLATTSWMIIDLNTKKAIEIPDFIRSVRIPEKKRALEDPFSKLPLPGEQLYQQRFDVRRSDLDINQHVNNVSYIEWAVEAIQADYMRDHCISGLEVSYRAECHYGDRIISKCGKYDDEPTFIHLLEREQDHQQVAVARTRLKNIRSSGESNHSRIIPG